MCSWNLPEKGCGTNYMKPYLALMKIDLKLALRLRMVIIFNYLFPLMFFIIYLTLMRVHQDPQRIYQVLAMVITMGVLGNGLFGAGMRAIQERETNILRRYKVTPITPAPLMVASMVTSWLIFMPYIIFVFVVSHYKYAMPWPSHLLEIFVFISVGMVAFRGIGMVIASVANSMQEGQILVQICYVPMIFFSGATVPADVFPPIMQFISNFIPATYLVRGIQNMMFHNQGLYAQRGLVGILLLAGALGATVAIKLFRWEKDEKIRTSAKLWVVAVLLPFLIFGVVKYQQQRKMTGQSHPDASKAEIKQVIRESSRS